MDQKGAKMTKIPVNLALDGNDGSHQDCVDSQ